MRTDVKTAIIDIGSNSVRLMLWAGGKSLYKKVATTRLGEGISLRPVLEEEPMERTLHAIALFCGEARKTDARVYAFATAAVRSAENGGEFCARVKERCGIDVDVVTGEEEAELALRGALPGGDGGIVDVGGASSEVCLRTGDVRRSVSLGLGAVRLFDACKDDPALLRARIAEELVRLDGFRPAGPVYAVGGTASTLACIRVGCEEYDAERVNGVELGARWMEETAEYLLSISAEERKKIAGMDVRRADIIGGGALLLASILQKLGVTAVKFSDGDNLEGYLYTRGLE